MKKVPFIILFFISAISFAQGKFIEVEVRDTLVLEPSRFEYLIRITDVSPDTLAAARGEDDVYDPKAMKQKYHEKAEELKKLLQSKKYVFQDLRDSNYEINSVSFYDENGFIVKLKTLDELRALKKLLSGYDYVSTSVGEVYYDDENSGERILIRKLITKALQKAMLIASETDLKLGKILEVKEVKEVDNATFNIMDTYLALGKRKLLGINDGSLKGNISKAMVVKFAIE